MKDHPHLKVDDFIKYLKVNENNKIININFSRLKLTKLPESFSNFSIIGNLKLDNNTIPEKPKWS